MKPMDTEEVIGAGSSEVEVRFAGLDGSIRDSISGDMQAEDDLLKSEKSNRADLWYKTVLEKAKQDYETTLADETDDGKGMQEMSAYLAQVEADIRDKEQSKADSALHSKNRYKHKSKTNGHLRQSIRA